MSTTREEIYKAIDTLIKDIETDEGKQIIKERNIKFEVLATTMDSEEWRDIEGYDGDYQVSNLGKVRSHKRGNEWRPLRPSKDKDGYLAVILSKHNKQKRYRVHRLVAMAFIPNSLNLPIVEHRDDNPKNAHVDNLFWSTENDNIHHAIERNLILRGEQNARAILTESVVKYLKEVCIPDDKKYGIRPLARKFKIDHSTLGDIIKGKTWKHVKI